MNKRKKRLADRNGTRTAVRKLIRGVDSTINFMVLVAVFLAFVFGCYGLWDSHRIYQEAEEAHYEAYKPTEEDELSFQELTAINPEVIGWLSVYGTNIDYPIVQAANNEKYISTNVLGEYSLVGSIFLDYRNERKFTDFNSLLYGHHMEKGAMFGDIEKFAEQSFLEQHPYGNLYYGGKNHGLEFWDLLEVNAYDQTVYAPAITDMEARRGYLDRIQSKAICRREIEVSPEDRILLLTTCSSQSTDGRYILAGKITDQIYSDTFRDEEKMEISVRNHEDRQTFRELVHQIPVQFWLGSGIVLGILVVVVLKQRKKHKNRRR